MGYNVAFPVVATTTAIIVLICLFSFNTNGSGGNVLIPPAAVPDIIIEGLGDVCYFDDVDCLSTLDPGLLARTSVAPRVLSLDNEMVYLERDPTNPNIKRLYRFQGGCGFQHVRNDVDKYITMWPHLEGGEGIIIEDICDPGQPIIISVNTSELNITASPSNNIVPSCGVVPSFLNDTTSLAILLVGTNGVDITDRCSPGDPIVIAFDPIAVNISEVVDVWFGAQCGVSITENAGAIDISLELQGLNGIAVSDSCPGDAAVNITFDPSAVNAIEVYEEWFVDGCGITHSISGGDIVLSVNATGANGVVVDPLCGAGDALGLTFDPSAVNMTEAGNVWFVESCGTTVDTSSGQVAINTVLEGGHGITVNATCAPGDPIIISWDASEVNLTDLVDMVFNGTCGISIPQDDNTLAITLHFDGTNGIVVDDVCAMGEPIVLNWDPFLVNATELMVALFGNSCGFTFTESGGTITGNMILNGANGIEVTDVCAPGGGIDLAWNESAVNLTSVVDNWYGSQCGVTVTENAGSIELAANFIGEGGIMVDNTCASGEVILRFNASQVNSSDAYEAWFVDGCGITHSPGAETTELSTNIAVSAPLYIDGPCGAGDTLVIALNASELNITGNIVFGDTCGASFVENMGATDVAILLNGINGIVVDDSCPMDVIDLSWSPGNVNVTEVLSEWFTSGCGISLMEAAGEITVAANIVGGNGIGITMGCMAGDSLELYFNPNTLNVSEFVDVIFGSQCGISAIENAGVIDLKAELSGTNGITIDETCSGADVIVSWNPANVNTSVVLTEWFIAGCGISLMESGGDIVVAANIVGSNGIGVAMGCVVGDSLELYFNPNTLNVSEFTDVIIGTQCGISAIENGGVIDLKAELNGTNGITIDESCSGPDVIVGFDPLLTDTTGVNTAWFRDTCGVSRSIMGGDIGFDLGIVGDGIITVDNTCPGTETDIIIGINVSALNIPDLGDACLIYGNASLSPAAELVRPEGFLFHRIIAEDACDNRRTHFYIDLPHAPLGFGMLIGVNNVFTGTGVRSSVILGGENNAVAGGSQFTTTLNGQNHVTDIAGDYGLIGGGDGHMLNGAMNVALMGTAHILHAGSSYSIVVNGISNVVGPFVGPTIRQFITITNGLNNVVKSAFSTIHNGVGNLIEDGASSITGAVIVTGSSCIVRGSYSVILGATSSTNNGQTSLIGVGDLHFMANTAVYSVIAGGERHVVNAPSGGVFVGFSCTVSAGGTNSWIGGGRFNNVLGVDGFVLAGNTNVNNAARSGIGAGRNHNVGVLATDSFILAGDGITLALATDAFTAASQHLLAVGALRTSGISTSNSPNWNLSFGTYFYLNFRSGASIRLPTTMPEGTKFVIRNNSAGTATPDCAFNGCTICPQGTACTLNGNIVMTTQTAVSFIFIGNNYYVL